MRDCRRILTFFPTLKWTMHALVHACLVLLLVICVFPGSQGGFNLTLLHTANTFSQVLAVGQFGGPCQPTNNTRGNSSYVDVDATLPCVGGFARRTTLINSIRDSVTNSLLIDAGYLFTGSIFWTVFGAEMLGHYYRLMGYDAIRIGLFEFFGGVEKLAKFIDIVAPAHVVAANLDYAGDQRLSSAPIVPYAIFTFANGDKVGFAATLVSQVGTRFEDARSINSYDEVHGMLRAVGSLLNQGVNKIIVSVSDGNVLDDILAAVPGIDIVILPNTLYANEQEEYDIVSGTYPQVKYMNWEGSNGATQPVLVVASGIFGLRLGRLDVSFDDYGVLSSWGGDSIWLDASIDADQTVQQDILSRMQGVEESSSKVVGVAQTDIQWENSCTFGECAIGNWIAEVFRNTTGTDIGMVNGGAVYGPFHAGNITLGEYLMVFPFGWNFLYTLSLEGGHLLAALEHSVSLADQKSLPLSAGVGRFMSVAGLRFTWNPNEIVGQRIADVWYQTSGGHWQPFDQRRQYSITVSDFIANGGDSYDDLAANAINTINTRITAATAIEAMLAKSFAMPIYSVVDGRITTSNGSRIACVGPDEKICSDNGYCLSGVCHCTVPQAAGPLCVIGANGNDTNKHADGIVGVAVPAVTVTLIVIAVCALLLGFLIFRLTRKKKEDWYVNFDELEIEEKLGEGSFGEVYKGKWKGTEVAVKVMTPGMVTKEMKRGFIDEMRVMSTLRHPNVVLFMGASSKLPRLCIIMEYMTLGSLYDVLHNDFITLPMTLSLKLALGAAKGMHFLHSSGIVHRDLKDTPVLKSLNLLLDSKWNVKVSDFGLGKFKDQIKAHDGHIGSIPWSAPEVLAELPDIDYLLADVYSYGVVLFEIATRKNPYDQLSPAAIAVSVLRDGRRPISQLDQASRQCMPEELVKLMEVCWDADKALRPTFLELMTRLEFLVANQASHHSSYPRYDQAVSGEQFEIDKPPQGPVVIGFTDIADAALLWELQPTVMRDATLIHNEVIRMVTRRYGGVEATLTVLDNHGEGLFCVAFPRAAVALEWAAEVQHQLLHADWPKELLKFRAAAKKRGDVDGRLLFRGLRVKMGFHIGEPEIVRDKISDAFRFRGDVVKCAAQLAQKALGGQVLITEAVRNNLRETQDSVETSKILHRLHPLDEKVIIVDSEEELFEFKVNGLEARRFREEHNPEIGVMKTTANFGSGQLIYSSKPYTSKKMTVDLDFFQTSANLCRWIIDYEELRMLEQIGTGSYGLVYLAKWRGIEVAVKRFVKQTITEKQKLDFRAEVAVLASLRHPNIVLFIGACLQRPNMCIVTEFVKRGSLRNILSDYSLKLPLHHRLMMMRGAALGIAYLHSLKPTILHRDLNSANLLVDEAWNIKVADFGFARIKEENSTMTRCGTPCWTAPEIIRGERYSEKADIFSFGIVLWEVLTRRLPYANLSFMNIALEVLDGLRPEIPSDCPCAFRDLITQCWHQSPAERPTIEQVVTALNALIGEEAGGGDLV